MSELHTIMEQPDVPPATTVAYGPGPERVVDVWLPDVRPAPLVVALHGGFWRAKYDRAHLRPLAAALAAAGYAVAVPEYHRTGQDEGGWPGTFDDVAAALDAVPELLADDVTGPPVWIGHSAGGQLALWAAARPRLRGTPWYRDPPPVRRVVALAGCARLARASELGLGGGAADRFMGGTPAEVPERYELADPSALLPAGVPVTLVHGAADDILPAEISRDYAASARALGDPVTLRELPGIDHFDLIDPLSAAWPDVLAAVRGPGD